MRQKLPDQKKSGIYFRIAHMQNGYDAYHAPNSIKSFLTAPYPSQGTVPARNLFGRFCVQII